METYWHSFLSRYPIEDRMLFVYGSWFLLEVTFWGFNGFLWLIYRNNWFSKYKISPETFPDSSLVKDCLIHLAINNFLLRPFILYFLYPSFQKFGLHTSGEIPSLSTFVFQILFFIVVNDTTFYWSHRLLHHRAIYKHIHKKHHQFKSTIGIASEYAHPVEDILSNALPSLLGPLLVGPHIVVFWVWIVLRVIETVDAHSGYNFPFSPFRIFPYIQGGADRHDFHHSHNVGNYGSFFTFWDKICGTDKDYNLWKSKLRSSFKLQ